MEGFTPETGRAGNYIEGKLQGKAGFAQRNARSFAFFA
jgi:hypothetical protein